MEGLGGEAKAFFEVEEGSAKEMSERRAELGTNEEAEEATGGGGEGGPGASAFVPSVVQTSALVSHAVAPQTLSPPPPSFTLHQRRQYSH